jgi:excisionase family DNA binding protein
MQHDPVNELVCAKTAAALLGCSTWTLYQYCKRGEIPHVRIGRMIRFRLTTLHSWIRTREMDSVSAHEQR